MSKRGGIDSVHFSDINPNPHPPTNKIHSLTYKSIWGRVLEPWRRGEVVSKINRNTACEGGALMKTERRNMGRVVSNLVKEWVS